MAFTSLRRAFGALGLTLLAFTGSAVEAQPVREGTQACGGRDLLPELKARNADVAKRLEAAAVETPNAKAILWRIEKEGIPPSHIFGTIHLSDERVTNITPAIQEAIDGSRVVALEIADLSPAALAQGMSKVQNLLQMQNGQTLDTVLGPGEMSLAQDLMQKAGVPPAALVRLRPWVVSMSLALTDCERARTASGLKPLDEQLGIRASVRSIQLISLETVEAQMRAMAAVPDADQVALLKAALKLHPLTGDMIETLVRRYLASDLGAIWQMQVELWRDTGVSDEAAGNFLRQLVTIRNARMRDVAMPYVMKGGTFIAVGALHLPGKDGLVALFEQAGFKATPVE